MLKYTVPAGGLLFLVWMEPLALPLSLGTRAGQLQPSGGSFSGRSLVALVLPYENSPFPLGERETAFPVQLSSEQWQERGTDA